METVTFHLAEDEVRPYKLICRAADVDPGEFRSGRKVTAPVFHWVEVAVGFSELGGEIMKRDRTDSKGELFDGVEDWIDSCGGILDKFAAALHDAGLKDRAEEMHRDDPRVDMGGGPQEEMGRQLAKMYRMEREGVPPEAFTDEDDG